MDEREKIVSKLKEKIGDERKSEESISAGKVVDRVLNKQVLKARGNLIFHSDAGGFSYKLKFILEKINEDYKSFSQDKRLDILLFLSYMCIDLKSSLTEWHLKKVMDEKSINSAFRSLLKVVERLEKEFPEDAGQVMKKLRIDTVSRFKAEGLTEESDINREVDLLLGSSITGYIENITGKISESNLSQVTAARFSGKSDTEIGNDYAAFLQYVLWLGGSFVTTNPVLIKVAWDINPDYWNMEVDRLIKSHYNNEQLKRLLTMDEEEASKQLEDINSLITMSVVEENCLLLRDIFLATGGSAGNVSLQVNPKNHSDGREMVAEAENLYKELEKRLGGVPNVVFKLPGTAGGKYAAEKLTSEGIGVNITVNFGAFQSLGMGEVLKEGATLVSYISFMSGRMAFPVRDELKEKGVEGGEPAARLSGVEVARKIYRRFYTGDNGMGLEIDKEKVKLVIASLRIYDGWIPDILELYGTSVITVFPNVRREFDKKKQPFKSDTILDSTPEDVLEVLFKSEIFRQAWWMPGDPEDLKPQRVLSLEECDSGEVEKWEPAAKTIGQFVTFYDQMRDMVKERIKFIVGQG